MYNPHKKNFQKFFFSLWIIFLNHKLMMLPFVKP